MDNYSEYNRWLIEVNRQAIKAGISIDSLEFHDTLYLLFMRNEEPGNAIKRYVDTRIRLNAISESSIQQPDSNL